jgi:hypothetical protein
MIPLDEINLLGKLYQEFITQYYNDLKLLERISDINRPFACLNGIRSPRQDFMNVYWVDRNRYIEFDLNMDQLGFKDSKMTFRNCNKNFYFSVYCKHDDRFYVMVKEIYELDLNLFQSVEFHKHSDEFYAFLKALHKFKILKRV